MITTLEQLVGRVTALKKKRRISVAWAQDPHTIGAVHKAVLNGFAEAVMIGNPDEIAGACRKAGIDERIFTIVESADDQTSAIEAVRMTKNGEADIVMKGLVGSDVFLRAVMDREKGLMLPEAVLTYVGAIEIPAYHKLLFITDPAVIPFPDLDQKIAMAGYAIEMAARFGIEKPRIALIGASEKKSRHFPSNADYVQMCTIAKEGRIGNCIMDGPLDLFLACDRKSVRIKGVKTPVDGDADILLFPSLEASNPFYKALMLFASGELAGLIRGTTKPVVLMSRSESEKSKYYCIALACLMT
jgi:phosphate butyryltransferase